MADKWNPGHYLILAYTQRAANNLHRIDSPYISGLQCNYRWRELEPTEGNFDFANLTADLAALSGAGKKMVLQLRDKYDAELPAWVAASNFVKTDSAGKKEVDWENPTARQKLLNLHTALAAHCDSSAVLVGVTLKETAAKTVGGITAGYTEAAKSFLGGALSVFATTPVFLYVNWSVDMASMAQFIASNQRAGWGGPDVICVDSPNRNPSREANTPDGPPSYPYFTSLAGAVPLCCAVQSPSLCGKETAFDFNGTFFSAQELFEQGVDAMNLNYMFWDQWAQNSCPTNWDATCRPYIESQSGRINTTRPANLDGGDPLPNPVIRGPYQGVTRQIPGTIPSVAFDAMTQGGVEVLGQGVTYNESGVSTTWGSPPRYVEGAYPQTASADGLSKVRLNAIGEWREYTVSIATSGTYVPSIVAIAPTAPASPAVRFRLDGVVIAEIEIGATSDWTYANKQKFSGSPVALTASASSILRLEVLANGWDDPEIIFELTSEDPVDPPVEPPDPPVPASHWERRNGRRVLVIGPFAD